VDIIGSLFKSGGFSPGNFSDLFYPVAIAALVFLIGTVILYNVQVRRLHHHPPLVALQEWLLWTGLAVFGLLIVYCTFKFYFAFVLVTLIIGLGTFVWIRFIRFPPIIEAYNQALRRERFLSQKRFRDADATIRSKSRNKARAGARKKR
jgi:hypothetical protein